MPNFPAWLVLSVLAYGALVFAGPFLLGGGILLLAIPALRRRRGLRRTAYGMLAACPALLLCAVPVLEDMLSPLRYSLQMRAARHHLSAPQTFDGIQFPAGSTVQLSITDGKVESGNVPVPTVIAGLPLVGDFDLLGEIDFYVKSGTLAAPAVVNDVPCAPGPIRFSFLDPSTTRCVLARDHEFQGHWFAGGQAFEVVRHRQPRPDDEAFFPDQVQFGVLAKPEALFGTTWPAGTMVGGITDRPEEMTPEADGQDVAFCLPDGATADIGVATLHGFIAYYVRSSGYLRVFTECKLVPERGHDMSGYVQVGPDRFHIGSRSDRASPWTWSTEPHW